MTETPGLSGVYGYNITFQPRGPFSSFQISRNLQGREQLDLSRDLGLKECELFLHSYWPVGKDNTTAPGCVNLSKFWCARIWLN